MKRKKIKMMVVGMLLIFLATSLLPGISGKITLSIPSSSEKVAMNKYSARVFLGIIGVRAKEIDGPENYVGPLTDVDFNIVGTNTWVDIWPLFNPLMPISFGTDEPITIHIDYFRGILRNFEGHDHIAGLAYKISWEAS